MTMFFYLASIDILCSHRNLQKKANNRVNRTAIARHGFIGGSPRLVLRYALKMKNTKTGFAPIVGENPKLLILGTMPGEESLRKGQYYANQRNAFWIILGRLLKFDPDISYEERKEILKENYIALWDVLMTCEREGSLDSSIDDTTLFENDFLSFYTKYPTIKHVFFNGAKAEKEYKKRVLPVVQSKHQEIKYIRLPSTSPAMARLTKEEKLVQWSAILNKLK